MDKFVVDALTGIGMDVGLTSVALAIPIQISEERDPIPLDDKVFVLSGKLIMPDLRLKKISELFAGARQPPDFRHGPTEEYVIFFALIEMTAWDYCRVTGRIDRDVEFERMYNLLRRRPDSRDYNPLFSYLQGMVRLYMSLRDVSQAEFEAVVARLAKSARTFSEGPTSTNYHQYALSKFADEG